MGLSVMFKFSLYRSELLRLLSLVFLCTFFPMEIYAEAKLLNPHGEGNGYWEANGNYNCTHLKPRFSYLTPGGKYADSELMVRLLRTTYAEGMAVVESGNYSYKTCLSVSYNKEWVVGATEDYRDAEYPTIVYAYSVPRGNDVATDGYDVYWFSEDDSYPLVEGSCVCLFQNDPMSYIEDVSGIADWKFRNITSMAKMFRSCENLKIVSFHDVAMIDKSLSDIFDRCTSLESVELKGDFSKVTNINIFNPSKNVLKSVSLDGDFSGLTSMRQLFNNFKQLCSVTLDGDFSNVTDITYLFDGCASIPSASVKSNANPDAAVKIMGDFSKVSSFLCLFRDCSALTTATVDLAAFPSVTNMEAMFEGCAETSFSMGGGDADITIEGNYNKITSLAWLLKEGEKLKTVTLLGDFSNVASFKEFTNACQALESLTLDGDFSSLKTLEGFSTNCTSMKTSVITGDFSNLTDNISAFYSGCPNIQSVVLEGDFSKANKESFNAIFKDKKKLKTLTVKGDFNTLTTMRFFTKNCTALETLIIDGNFDALERLEASFEDCHSLVAADVNIASTRPSSNLTMISWAFKNNPKLRSVNLNGDFSHVTDMKQMFYNDSELSTVSINNGNADFTSLQTIEDILYGADFETQYTVLSSLLSQMKLDVTKFPGGKSAPYRVTTNKTWNRKNLLTKNSLPYKLDEGFLVQGIFLPIELSYFVVSQEDGDVLFTWETASETNNDFFTIERSVDGIVFNEIARVDGAGTTTLNTMYDYSIPVDFSGINYFRLKQTDFNGDYAYSAVQTISVIDGPVHVYPMPATDYIVIEGDYCSVKFADQQGRIHVPLRTDTHTYPVSSFPRGIYYAIITMKNGEIVTRPFVKK